MSLRALSPSFPWRPRPKATHTPSQAAAADSARAAVGVDFLIEAAGGEEAVVRAAATRLRRMFREVTPLEGTEALAITLVDRAPEAIAQLGAAAGETISAAARKLHRYVSTRRIG
jgi:hypothetical protein